MRAGNGEPKLPVHGFVLAGGKSSRMGVDKATLEFRGRPMVEIAVEKLRGFCADVSIVGNRDDLRGFAEVIREERVDCGPAAGIEAGLKAARWEWAMFVPVDVPLMPGELLRRWVEATIAVVPEFEETVGTLLGSSLYTKMGKEPAFAVLRPEVLSILQEGLDAGERRLDVLLGNVRLHKGDARFLRVDAAWHASSVDEQTLRGWFANVNTPEDLAGAETWAVEAGREG